MSLRVWSEIDDVRWLLFVEFPFQIFTGCTGSELSYESLIACDVATRKGRAQSILNARLTDRFAFRVVGGLKGEDAPFDEDLRGETSDLRGG